MAELMYVLREMIVVVVSVEEPKNGMRVVGWGTGLHTVYMMRLSRH